MASYQCPHCGYDRTAGALAKGVGKGVLIATIGVFSPLVGAVLLLGNAARNVERANSDETRCPGCDKYYS